MEEDNPPGKEDEPPEGRSDRPEGEVDAITTKGSDGTLTNPVLPVLNHTPVKLLPKGNLTPDGRKYRLLHDELKVKYRELHTKNHDIQEKLKKSEELLQKFAIENESLRQENEALVNRCSQKVPESRPSVMKMTNEDIFIAKLKKSTKSSKPSPESCESCATSGCENTNADVDFIKCNLCNEPVCEDCSSTKISKLRPLMNQCSTLYFTCQACDILMREKDVDVYDTMKEKIIMLKGELESCEKQNAKLSNDASASQRMHEMVNKLSEESKSKDGKIDELQNSIKL